MKHLLNTLFVLTEDAYLSLENENVVVLGENKVLGRMPLHTLEQILYFGYKGASPALMGKCVGLGIGLSFFKINGYFLAKVDGRQKGNVLLRKAQYRISDDESRSNLAARNFIVGKLFNARSVLERAKRDHPLSIDITKVVEVSKALKILLNNAKNAPDLDVLRGVEGEAASRYFRAFNELILQNKATFNFSVRSKRPPRDPINALLSFVYNLLANDCVSALEGVGLDSYVGFLHRDRPGRKSLALDLMEEFRSIYADRFVLTLINTKMIKPKDFEKQENGAVFLSKNAKKVILSEWQNKKKDVITHPFLNERIPWGLVPHIQALLLARCIRVDLDEYPAFLWK